MNRLGLNPQNHDRKTFFQGSARALKNNVGFNRGNAAGAIAAAPINLLNMGVTKLMRFASRVDERDSVQLKIATDEALVRSGLKDKGIRVLTMEETKPLNIFQRAKQLREEATGIFSELKQEAPSLDNIIGGVERIVCPYTYSKNDMEALGAIKEEVIEGAKDDGLIRGLFKRISGKSVENTAEEGIKQAIEKTTGDKEASNFIINLVESIKGQADKMKVLSSGIEYKTGSNAAYLKHAQAIITPDRTLQTSVFHEMGHALNYTGGAALKVLQKSKSYAAAIPAFILALSLTNPRKTTDEKSESKIQNIKDFVKKNAGKLSFIAMLPVIAEEGIASFRGQGIAKSLVKDGLLSKKTLNKVRLTNALALSTYIMGAAALGITAKVAVSVKDKSQDKYDIKQEEKLAKKQAKFEAKEAKAAKKAGRKAGLIAPLGTTQA